MLLSLGCTTKLPCNIPASSTLGQKLTNLAATLDAFNSGTLTPVCIARTTPPFPAGCSGT